MCVCASVCLCVWVLFSVCMFCVCIFRAYSFSVCIPLCVVSVLLVCVSSVHILFSVYFFNVFFRVCAQRTLEGSYTTPYFYQHIYTKHIHNHNTKQQKYRHWIFHTLNVINVKKDTHNKTKHTQNINTHNKNIN